MKKLSNFFSDKYQVIITDPDNPLEGITMAGRFVKTKKSLKKEWQVSAEENTNILDHLNKSIPLIIVFSGNKILTRQVTTTTTGVNLFEEVDADEFYFFSAFSESNYMIQSIIRKQMADNAITLLKTQNLFVLGFTLAFGTIISLEGIIHTLSFTASGWHFTFNDSVLTHLSPGHEKHQTPIEIGEERYTDNSILLLGALVSYFKGWTVSNAIISDSVIHYKYYTRSKKYTILVLTFLFLISLVNFFLYYSFSAQIKEIKSRNRGMENLYTHIEILEKQLHELESLKVLQTDKGKIPFAYYADRIAIRRPQDIWLNVMEIQPVKKKIENNKLIETDESLVRIIGDTRNPSVLNNFIAVLQSETWVKDIRIIHYKSTQDNPFAKFEMHITKQ